MQKCQMPKFLFDPLWTNTFGGALAPQVDFGLKKCHEQKVLKYNVKESLFCAKNIKLENFSSPTYGGPLVLHMKVP